MPEMQPSMPTGATAIAAGLDASAYSTFDDSDFALGCECADPALQIERWMHEASGGAEAA
jgi:hypothetical protein